MGGQIFRSMLAHQCVMMRLNDISATVMLSKQMNKTNKKFNDYVLLVSHLVYHGIQPFTERFGHEFCFVCYLP